MAGRAGLVYKSGGWKPAAGGGETRQAARSREILIMAEAARQGNDFGYSADALRQMSKARLRSGIEWAKQYRREVNTTKEYVLRRRETSKELTASIRYLQGLMR